MAKFVLTRTHFYPDWTHGTLTIEGLQFSCYTQEKCSPRMAGKVMRPSLCLAVPADVYRLGFANRLGFASSYVYPFTPTFSCRGYKPLFFQPCSGGLLRPGCINVGTKFVTEHTLLGFDDVMGALQQLVYSRKLKLKETHWLHIVEGEDATVVDEDEEEDLLPDYNFADL